MQRGELGIVVALAMILGACAADVRLEDDGGDGSADGDDGGADGDGADGDGAHDAGSGSAEGGASALSPERAELAAACEDLCQTRCVGSTRYCERDCQETVDACVTTKLTAIRCMLPGDTGPCPQEADPLACDDAWSDVWGCEDVHECGHSSHGEDTVCSVEGPESCDCVEQCDDGHVGEASCVLGDLEQVCQCWFDGAYAGECRRSGVSVGCRVTDATCCMALYR